MEIYCDLSQLDVYADTVSGIAMYNHPTRGCIYDEAKACVIMGKAKKKDVKVQMARYYKQGMPKHYGICECNVIVRQTANKMCKKLMSEWWTEFQKSTVKRDQIVFPYILWKNGIDMFELADESYAVQNAHEYLKKLGPRLSPQMMRLVSQNGLMNILSWCERTYRET